LDRGWIGPRASTEAVARRKTCRFHCSDFSVLQFPYVKIILRRRQEKKRQKKKQKRRKYEKEWKEGTNTKK
jgi:hypothetical protein